jgi:hypothetical protein
MHQDRYRLGQNNEVMTLRLGQTYLDLGLLRLPRSFNIDLLHLLQLRKTDQGQYVLRV